MSWQKFTRTLLSIFLQIFLSYTAYLSMWMLCIKTVSILCVYSIVGLHGLISIRWLINILNICFIWHFWTHNRILFASKDSARWMNTCSVVTFISSHLSKKHYYRKQTHEDCEHWSQPSLLALWSWHADWYVNAKIIELHEEAILHM